MFQILKNYIPTFIKIYLKRVSLKNVFLQNYKKDLIRYLDKSRTYKLDSKNQLRGAIIATYHVIEKGLTMPESRLGFGKEKLLLLCKLINDYIAKYTLDDEQVIHGIKVVLEYEELHINKGYELDAKVNQAISILKKHNGGSLESSCQAFYEVHQYFEKCENDFAAFSASRASIRNYSQINIEDSKLTNALQLAQSTPSACNRQSIRPYIYFKKNQINKILEIQGGNRGFGHLSNRLIVVTAELGVYAGVAERNLAYVDGGLYTMNLLYGLHYNKIAACVLNCSLTSEKEELLRRECEIKDSEVFIAMITCGIPPEKFNVAISKRMSINEVVTFKK